MILYRVVHNLPFPCVCICWIRGLGKWSSFTLRQRRRFPLKWVLYSPSGVGSKPQRFTLMQLCWPAVLLFESLHWTRAMRQKSVQWSGGATQHRKPGCAVLRVWSLFWTVSIVPGQQVIVEWFWVLLDVCVSIFVALGPTKSINVVTALQKDYSWPLVVLCAFVCFCLMLGSTDQDIHPFADHLSCRISDLYYWCR